MAKKMEIIAVSIGAASLLVAIAAWRFPVSKNLVALQNTAQSKTFKDTRAIVNSAYLNISGTGAIVTIKEGSALYDGGNIAGMNSNAIIHISKNQKLNISVSAKNVTLYLQSSIVKNVVINSTSQNTSVQEI